MADLERDERELIFFVCGSFYQDRSIWRCKGNSSSRQRVTVIVKSDHVFRRGPAGTGCWWVERDICSLGPDVCGWKRHVLHAWLIRRAEKFQATNSVDYLDN